MINTNYRYALENVGLSTSTTTITTATNSDGNVEVTYRPGLGLRVEGSAPHSGF